MSTKDCCAELEFEKLENAHHAGTDAWPQSDQFLVTFVTARTACLNTFPNWLQFVGFVKLHFEGKLAFYRQRMHLYALRRLVDFVFPIFPAIKREMVIFKRGRS